MGISSFYDGNLSTNWKFFYGGSLVSNRNFPYDRLESTTIFEVETDAVESLLTSVVNSKSNSIC